MCSLSLTFFQPLLLLFLENFKYLLCVSHSFLHSWNEPKRRTFYLPPLGKRKIYSANVSRFFHHPSLIIRAVNFHRLLGPGICATPVVFHSLTRSLAQPHHHRCEALEKHSARGSSSKFYEVADERIDGEKITRKY